MGRLPEQTSSNLAMVSTAQRQLESATTATRGEQDRLSMIERQIESMQQGADEAVAATRGTPAETSQSRVLTLRRELADAQLSFTDKHPEIVRLKEEIATAEKAAAAERARPASDRMAILNANPEYRQLLKDRETTTMRIAESQRQQAAITAQIGHYQGRVEAAPRVEQQLRLAATRVRPRARVLWRPDGEAPDRALERGAAAQAGRRAVRRARAGRPAVRPVQAQADARDADGDCRGPGHRRRVARSAASTSIARSTTPVACATNSSCRCWRRSRASNR